MGILMNTRQVALGGLLLFISTGVLLETGIIAYRGPLLVAASASFGIAAGSLLVGAVDSDPAE